MNLMSVRLSADVSRAIAEHSPVVALESTIISHGMPYPDNLALARQACELIRARGCVPATVAIMDGVLCVGLEDRQLERLATEDGILKVSRRDLAYAVAAGRTGATTVCATMIAAHRAGVPVFATGGIGGVHLGQDLDVSADLTELAGTPVIVVSAGAKAILDLPRTLEVLETLGVPVVGYGTDEFPAFYSRHSGLPVGLRADSAREVARLYRAQRDLGLDQGILLANPVPEQDEIPADVISGYLDTALSDLRRQEIRGKGVTPFLLSRIVELSGGAALETNKLCLSGWHR